MKEAYKYCFRLKIHKTILHQMEIVKHECRKITAEYRTCVYRFPPDKESYYRFSTRNNCYEFLPFDGVNLQHTHQQILKQKSVVLRVAFHFLLFYFILVPWTVQQRAYSFLLSITSSKNCLCSDNIIVFCLTRKTTLLICICR